MTKYERHPAPEKLLRQITTGAVNLLVFGTPDQSADISLLETGVALTVKAWELPQELLDDSTALLKHQKELLEGTHDYAVLPDELLLEPYDGPMAAELIWGLFETAVKLENAQDRAAIHRLALLLADILDFDGCLERNEPGEEENEIVREGRCP